jgi:hypothetical protein
MLPAMLDSTPTLPHLRTRLSRERSGCPSPGAEGATAPETLRQKDREALTNAGKRRIALRAARLAEGARTGAPGRNLSGAKDSGGVR